MSSKVTLDTCDSEPIAFPAAIQSHGMLLVLDQELKIRQISENCLQFLGFEPGDVLNNSISKYLDEEQFEAFKIYLAFENLKALVPLPVKFCLPDGVCTIFHCAAQRYPNFVIVELEPILGQPQELSLPSSLSIAIENLQSKRISQKALQNAAECVKEMTGYDRVLVYKFDADWHGEVIAEAAGNLPESFLGLHFPASDIPHQARELYKRNLLRMIVEVNYDPVKITPEINPVTNELLDMSDCALRSVSPIHVEYLSNMGVKATLTISLILNGQLWGLIACHHYSPKFLSGWLRTACDMFGRLTSIHLKGLIDAEIIKAEKDSSDLLDEFITIGLRQNADLSKTFDIYANKLQNIFNASGIALIEDEVVTAKGLVPSDAVINKLTSYIFSKEETIFSTDNLQEIMSDNTQDFAGILSIRTSYLRNEWLIFFREEQPKLVNWAGNPNKLIQSSEGFLNLHPRASFALWTEEVKGRSLPWTSNDLIAAKLLRERMLDLRQEYLDRERLREQDLHQQREDFFAGLTHDLKNPILGTIKILEFMKTGKLKAQGEQYEAVLDQLIKAQNQVYERIKSFLLSHKYSVAESTFSYQPLSVKEAVDRAISMVNLFASTEDINIECSIDENLNIIAEIDGISRVIENLLSNAIKFSISGSTINLSARRATSEVIISIQDRGPGIPESEIPLLFKRFWQGQSGKLTASSTGLGLYTCRQIVEAHNGKIWCENVPDVGAKFSIRLPAI